MAKAKTPKSENEPKSAPKQATQRFSIERKADGTVLIKISVPWNEVEKARDEVVSELVKLVELPGFRKGNAPRKLAEERISKEKIKEELLKKILTKEYVDAVKALEVRPIINPRIHIEEFEDGTALSFEAETAEEPKVDLKNYKDEVKKIKPSAPKIVVPGQPEPKDEPNKKLDEILNTVLTVAEINIPKILIDSEVDRLLSQMIDELKRLGVSLDQYLQSRGKTGEQIRAEYQDRAEKDLKLEFLLRKIADDEKITVEQADIEKALGSITDEKQKQEISQNPYMVAAIIRQQKTLDYLTKL